MDELDELIQQLSDPDPQVRKSAAVTISHFGHTGWAAVPALIKALDDRRPEVRKAVVKALGEIGLYAHDVGPRLCEMLTTHKLEHFRLVLVEAILEISTDPGIAVPALLAIAPDSPPRLRKLIVKAFELLGPDAAEAAPWLWRQMLSNPKHTWDGPKYWDAQMAIGPGTVPLLPQFLKAMKKPASRLPALVGVGAAAGFVENAAVVPALVKVLSTKDRWEWRQAILALCEVGPALAHHSQLGQILPVLVKAAVEDGVTREKARDLLPLFDPTGEQVIPQLSEYLPDSDYAEEVLQVLEYFLGPGFPRREEIHLPERCSALGEEVRAWNRTPASAGAIKLLSTTLQVEDVEARRHTVHLLRHLGKEAKGFESQLRQVIADDADDEVRCVAAEALYTLTGDPAPVKELVHTLLSEDNVDLPAVCATIQRHPKLMVHTTGPLQGWLAESEQDEVRFWVARALAAVSPNLPSLAKFLNEKLKDSWDDTRVDAARVLGSFRLPFPVVFRLLNTALRDEELEVRKAAAESAGKQATLPPKLLTLLASLVDEELPYTCREPALALLKHGKYIPKALATLSAGWLPLNAGWAALFSPHYLLSEFDDDPAQIRPILEEALTDDSEPVRLLAAINLARWGVRVPQCVRVMAEGASHEPDDRRLYLRVQALRILGKLNEKAFPALPALEQGLPGIQTWYFRSEMSRLIARLRFLQTQK